MQRVKTTYTDAQRQEALRLFCELGASEASRRTGIPVATISSWARRMVRTEPPAVTPTSPAAPNRLPGTGTIAERKGALVLGMLDDIERLRAQLFAPTVEKKALVVNLGGNCGSAIEIAEVHLTQPSYADQNRIVASMTGLLDKVLLLSGDATARVEQTGQQADDRAKAEATVLALAKRAA